MKILGVDYGRSKIGIAIAEGSLATPLLVFQVTSMDEAVVKVLQLVNIQQADKVVVGISENQMEVEQRRFISLLRDEKIEVDEYDETLTTQEAMGLSIQGGVGQKRRREMEDAFAATIMLQSYLDN